jgi:hypothetical protein
VKVKGTVVEDLVSPFATKAVDLLRGGPDVAGMVIALRIHGGSSQGFSAMPMSGFAAAMPTTLSMLRNGASHQVGFLFIRLGFSIA